MSLADKPLANPDAVLREEFDDWAVLFNPDTADAVGINPIGVAIWRLMDGQHTIGETVAAIQQQFVNVPGSAAEEIEAFIARMVDEGFVRYEAQTETE